MVLCQVEVVGVDGVGRAWLAEYDGERVPEATLRAQAMGATEGDQQRAARHMTMRTYHRFTQSKAVGFV